MASNARTLADEDGSYPDWVELHNPGPSTVELAGWSLSDDPKQPAKWKFQRGQLGPGQYLVVFASGKNRQATGDLPFQPREPQSIHGLTAWYEAESILRGGSTIEIVNSHEVVNCWVDLGPARIDLQPREDTARPEFVRGAVHGLGAVRFGGRAGAVRSAPVPGNLLCPSSEMTLVVVQKCASPACPVDHGSTILWQPYWRNRINLHALWSDDNLYFDFGDPVGGGRINAVQTSDFYDRWHVICVRRTTDGPASLRVNGRRCAEQHMSSQLATDQTAPFEVGASGFHGEIAEILVFGCALSDTELAGLESHLSSKYNLPLWRSRFHTSFALANGSESLALYAPDGTLVDSIQLSRTPPDVSIGRFEASGADVVLFAHPTPGQPNGGQTFAGYLSPPKLLLTPSTSFGVESVCVAHDDPNAVLRYSVDGAEPGENSPVLDAPVFLLDRVQALPRLLAFIPSNPSQDMDELRNHTMPSEQLQSFGWKPPLKAQLLAVPFRVRAFRDGFHPSESVGGTYPQPSAEPVCRLPIVSLMANPSDLFDSETGIYVPGANYDPGHWFYYYYGTGNYFRRGDDWERRGQLDFLDSKGISVFSAPVGIRIHGQVTRAFPQKSLRLYARGYLGKDSFRYSFFPQRGQRNYSTLLLRNFNMDAVFAPTLIRERLLSELVAPLELDVPASRPVVLLLNGEYWGIHLFSERLDEEYFRTMYGLGPDQIDILSNYVSIKAGDSVSYIGVLDYMRNHDLADEGAYATVQSLLDTTNFVDYMATKIYSAAQDWPDNNVLFWRSRIANPSTTHPKLDGRWRWLPVDPDGSLGMTGRYSDDTLGALLARSAGEDASADWATFVFRSLLKNASFRELFGSRFTDHLNSVFAPCRAVNMVDRLVDEVAAEMPAHIARWRRPGSIDEWLGNLATLREFCLKRPDYLRQHLAIHFGLGAPVAVVLRVDPPGAGLIQVNSLVVSPQTTGLQTDPYPWLGMFHKAQPLRIKAIANAGYCFLEWDGSTNGNSPTFATTLSDSATFIARFGIDASALDSLAPKPHDLRKAPYILDEWPADSTPGVFPPSMEIRLTKEPDSGLTAWDQEESQLLWRLPYNLVSRTRILGLGASGIGFLNTDKPQSDSAQGYAGAAVLALCTLGQTNLVVQWTSRTVTPNPTPYSIRLQYRVGTNGPFVDLVAGQSLQQYEANPSAPDAKSFAAQLPSAALDRPYVQLRWLYYASGENHGKARPCLALDDIVVAQGCEPPDYYSWIAGFLSLCPNATADDWSPYADPDGDGMPNLMEYAAGQRPDLAGQMPKLEIAPVPEGFLLSWSICCTAESVSACLEESTDLKHWSPLYPLTPLDAKHLGAIVAKENVASPGSVRYFRAKLKFNPTKTTGQCPN